ncbi:uncharacterized protein MELLADRAFT_25325, partial [Melampsora larici-populina 98AG31]
TFQNWAGNIKCKPRSIMRPINEDQIKMIIELSNREKREIRCFGAGHSPSDLACSEDYMINLDELKGEIHVDKEKMTIEVFAGTRLKDFHQIAKSHGLALGNLGSISDQSIGGLISTATHGSGARFGNLSTFVLSLSSILANTNQITVSNEENQDIFRATLCGLGTTGIITRVKFQCEPSFNLEEIVTELGFDEFVDRYDVIGKSAEHVRIYWFPHLDKVRIERLNRTKKDPTPTQSVTKSTMMYGYNHWVHPLNLLIGRSIPGLLHYHAALSYHFIHQPSSSEDPADSVSVFNFDCGPSQYTYEGAVPYEKTSNVLKELNVWMKTEISKDGKKRLHFPVEIRPVAADEIWLSPSYGRLSTYIGIVQYKPFGIPVSYKEIFKTFENILSNHDGRPHWAKSHQFSILDLQKTYPKLSDFLKLRKELDPNGRFLNPYIRRHLLGE